ncbi:transporter [Paraburkholderia sp. MM5384-R2]|uniref:SphA family protein n=1 Tax=Paraburkholderia sp. MM5384-R2 TaxID=2723097 RepID=UPI00160ADEBB|nr:transporter [Paraburkholderia sp. MM5384-R2]
MMFAALGSKNACALESGVSPYPAGAVGTNIAEMPPIPGLFALEQFSYSFSNGLYGNNGEKLPVPFHSSAFSATTRLLASYPFTVLGAHVYSQLVLPVVSLHTNIAGQQGTQNGLSNVTLSPVIMSWGLARNLTFTSGFDIAFETGSYSPSKPSVAVGYTSLQPVVSLRYNAPNGIDLGVANRLMINRENGATGYRSGTAYVGEFEAGWNIGKWKLGLVGAYLNQFTDDRLNGSVIGGNRAKTLGLGPSIVYDAGKFNINLNYQQGIYAANTSKSNAVWLNVAIPLWAKPPGPATGH